MSLDVISLADTTSFIVDNRGKTVPTVDEGIPLIKTNCITNGQLYPRIDGAFFVSNETYENWFRAHPLPGDLILTLKGSQNGAVALVPNPVEFVIAQDMVALRINPEVINPHYLLAALRSREVQHQIKTLDVSGVIPHLKKTDFDKLILPYPDRENQDYIGELYYSLSSKIETLREQNQTLEELAQTLFKRWFVEFEFPNENGQPYKSSGGKMVESELGEIPEGWRVAYLNTFISDSIGGDYGKEEPVGDFTEETTCLRGTDLPDMKTGLPERAPVRFIKPSKLKKCKLNTGDIVIEISGGTEGQSTGRAMYINEQVLSHYSRPMTCVNFCRILRPKTIESSYYSYLLLDFLYTRGVFFNLENGSTGIKNLDLKTLLNDYELPIPNMDLVQQFDSSIKGIFKKVQENNKEIQSLTQLRDTLLPKLMSGELRVKE